MVYEVETIKRQAKLRSVGWSWVSLCAQAQPMAYAQRWLGLWHDQRLWSSGKRLEALYKCYMPLPLPFAIFSIAENLSDFGCLTEAANSPQYTYFANWRVKLITWPNLLSPSPYKLIGFASTSGTISGKSGMDISTHSTRWRRLWLPVITRRRSWEQD